MKVISHKFQVTIFLIFATCYLLHATYANAEGVALGVYPPIFQIDATAPANIQAPLTIENQGNDPVNLRIEFRPFVSSDQEDGQIKYIRELEANFEDPLIFQRVKIFDGANQITTLSLSPQQKKDLTLRIDLPRDEPATNYYFSIIFLSGENPSIGSNSSQSVSGIASNVLLSIGPKGKANGNIQEFSSPFLVEKGPVPFTIRVKNTTNHFISPQGNILITNIFGQTIGRVDLAQTNILANTVRNNSSVWPEKFVLGAYKAKLTLALSDSGPIYNRDIIFFAFPFKTTAAILLGLLAIIYFVVKVKTKL